eukprot:TRINITY_DN86_c0_g1_i1.p1 TRINITY_DN86_c0_g1~~TRINITY_DN86_c0_g1_i1.p1  ORF type:complete len:266 (-),score=40.83 TRINITY_DN86_c0_g1_i1:262-1059(-)
MMTGSRRMSSVRAFAKDFDARYAKLDILVNNAGIMAQPEEQSKDGHDIQFQSNYLAHFLLTELLWSKLLAATASKPAEPARVVHHASAVHWIGAVKFDRTAMSMPPASWWAVPAWKLVKRFGGYPEGNWRRYCMSKLCNILFGLELQRRIEANGLGDRVMSVMCHPGYASTQLQVVAGNAGSMKNWQERNKNMAQSAADGALPLLRCCVDPSARGGVYYGPGGKNERTGPPVECKIGRHGRNPRMAADLWAYAEECCKKGVFSLS